LYRLKDREARQTYYKLHWKPTCELKFLCNEDAVIIGGINHSHATKDLYNAIDSGSYTEWKLCIKTMDSANEDRFNFDPLDDAKIWPENLFLLQPVGRMVLNRNLNSLFLAKLRMEYPDSYFLCLKTLVSLLYMFG